MMSLSNMKLPSLIEEYRAEEGNKHFYKIDDVWVWPMQNNQIFPLFEKLFKDNNFERIIEIGTAYGGLPILLRTMGFKGDMITYNIQDELKNDVENLFNKFIIIRVICDVFANEEIGGIISGKGGTLIICDGGDKPREVNTFSKYLKSGDVIITHDYFDTEEKFNSGELDEYWGVCEITYKDIKKACDDNEIEQIELKLSERAAMYVGRKK